MTAALPHILRIAPGKEHGRFWQATNSGVNYSLQERCKLMT